MIAYGKGGSLETIRGLQHPQPTGVFFEEQSPQAIVAAVALFEQHAAQITPQACRDNAMRFAPERFRREFTDLVTVKYQEFVQASLPFSGHPAIHIDGESS